MDQASKGDLSIVKGYFVPQANQTKVRQEAADSTCNEGLKLHGVKSVYYSSSLRNIPFGNLSCLHKRSQATACRASSPASVDAYDISGKRGSRNEMEERNPAKGVTLGMR